VSQECNYQLKVDAAEETELLKIKLGCNHTKEAIGLLAEFIA